jgi:hypothetical protein
MLDKWRSSEFEITLHAHSLLLAFFFSRSCSSVKTNKTTNNSPNFTLLIVLKFHSTRNLKIQLVDYPVSIMMHDLYYFICDDRAVYNDARFIPPKYI